MRFAVLSVTSCFAWLSLVGSLSGCAVFQAKPKPIELKPPVELEIPQAFVANDTLHLKVSVKPLVNLRSNQVALDIIGLNQGQECERQSRVLSKIAAEPIMKADEILVSDFEMPAKNLDEYKVVCKWNEDGIDDLPQKSVSKQEPKESSGRLPSESVSLTNQVLVNSGCLQPGADTCERSVSIRADLRNDTSQQLENIAIALAVRFVQKNIPEPASLNALEPLAADEQEVLLSGLTLSPGEVREIDVRIPDPLIELPDGAFVPRIRLLRYRACCET